MASPERFLRNPRLRGPIPSSDTEMDLVCFLSCIKETSKVGSIAGQPVHLWAMHLFAKYNVSLLFNSVVLKVEDVQGFKQSSVPCPGGKSDSVGLKQI